MTHHKRYTSKKKWYQAAHERGYAADDEGVCAMLEDLYHGEVDATYRSIGKLLGFSEGTIRNKIWACHIKPKTKNHTGRSNDAKGLPKKKIITSLPLLNPCPVCAKRGIERELAIGERVKLCLYKHCAYKEVIEPEPILKFKPITIIHDYSRSSSSRLRKPGPTDLMPRDVYEIG